MDKAEADRHDKMLELAELLAEVLQKAVPSLTEQQVEEAGIYMAKNRDVFAKAFKSQPDALSELLNAPAEVVEPVAVAAPVKAAASVAAAPDEAAPVEAPSAAPTKPAKAAKTPK
jgi:dsDNA-binding SOS-regulon protein